MSAGSRSDTDDSTTVTIRGRTYHLRGDDEAGYLERLAGIVDEKMKEIEATTGTADTTKVAILASLNLADDYLKASRGPATSRRRGNKTDAELTTRLERLTAQLDEALSS